VQWQHYEQEARARGVKLDFADFIPPRIPDAENFASIPVFEACAQAVDRGQKAPQPFELPKLAIGVNPEGSDAQGQKPIKLVAWQVYFFETKMLPAISDNAPADVLKALKKFDAPLNELREAARRPHCRFPIHWKKGAEMPQFTLLQGATRIYALRLNAHLAMGDSAAAAANFHDAIALVQAIRHEPSAIAGLVRIAMDAMIQNAVWDGLATRRWKEADLRLIEADLARLDWLDDDRFSMASERALCNSTTDKMSRRFKADLFHFKGGGDSVDAIAKDSRPVPLIAWFYYLNKLGINRFFDELSARAEPAQHRWHGERPISDARESIIGMFAHARYALFILITAPFEGVDAHFAHAAVMTDQTRLACALERCWLSRGEFPATLAELAPEFIDRVPADVVNGEPYHYRRTNDGSFVLYSVGSNLRDDGGVIDPKLSSSRQPDWVWRYPAK